MRAASCVLIIHSDFLMPLLYTCVRTIHDNESKLNRLYARLNRMQLTLNEEID